MDAAGYIASALAVVVILAGFWAFMSTQFVHKEVNLEQVRRLDEKLNAIAASLLALAVKTDVSARMDGEISDTLSDISDKLADIYRGKPPT